MGYTLGLVGPPVAAMMIGAVIAIWIRRKWCWPWPFIALVGLVSTVGSFAVLMHIAFAAIALAQGTG